MRKVMYIAPHLLYGGLSHQIYTLIRNINKGRYEITVVCLLEKGPLAEELEKLAIRVYLLRDGSARSLLNSVKDYCNPSTEKKSGEALPDGPSLYRKRGLLEKSVLRIITRFEHALVLIWLIRHIRRERPDVVHTYHFYANCVGRVAAIINRVPLIISTEANVTSFNLNRMQKRVSRFLSHFTHKVIAMSFAIRSSLIEYDGIRPGKIKVVYSAVDLNSIPPAPSGRHDNSKSLTVGIIGSLEPRKGHKYFLEAASIISRDIPDTRFIIAGDGPLRAELEDYAANLGLLRNLIFTGYFEDITDIMSRIDIAVLSSLTEGLPLAILEPMAFGKPVVATNVGGNPEAVIDGQTGLLVPSKDVNALANAISMLLLNRNLIISMGAEGRKYVAEKFNVERILEQLEQSYDCK